MDAAARGDRPRVHQRHRAVREQVTEDACRDLICDADAFQALNRRARDGIY